MDLGQAVQYSQDVIPEGHFLLWGRWRWVFLHVIVKVSEICVFQNNVVRLLTNKAAIEANDVRRGLSIVLEPYEAFLFGFVVYLGLCGLIGLQYVGVLVLAIRVLLSVRSVHWKGMEIHVTSGSRGISLS